MSNSTPPAAPVALTIAGSDNSAGAGAQADLKTMSALGVYGLTAITCVVAEVPGKVSAIQPIDREIVAEQIRLCFEAYPIAALKAGMLHSREIIEAMRNAKIDSPRGAWRLSKAHNPVQDMYLRKVVGKENRNMGLAIKALDDDPSVMAMCKMA